MAVQLGHGCAVMIYPVNRPSNLYDPCFPGPREQHPRAEHDIYRRSVSAYKRCLKSYQHQNPPAQSSPALRGTESDGSRGFGRNHLTILLVVVMLHGIRLVGHLCA